MGIGALPESASDSACPSLLVEGSHWNEGLLLGRPPEEPEQPLTENSLLEILDGALMMYNLSVHQQLGKVRTVGLLAHMCAVCISSVCPCECLQAHVSRGTLISVA